MSLKMLPMSAIKKEKPDEPMQVEEDRPSSPPPPIPPLDEEEATRREGDLEVPFNCCKDGGGTYLPKDLVCHYKEGCYIPPSTPFFFSQEDKVLWCTRCHRKATAIAHGKRQRGLLFLDVTTKKHEWVQLKDFERFPMTMECTKEGTIVCRGCSKKYHHTCALFIEDNMDKETFRCPVCVCRFHLSPQYPLAKDCLRSNLTSRFMEQELLRCVLKWREEMATRVAAKCAAAAASTPGHEDTIKFAKESEMDEHYLSITVRPLMSVEKTVPLKGGCYSFREQLICAFSRSEVQIHADVIFFVMFVQEFFEKNCPKWLRGSATIKQLSMFPFVRPKEHNGAAHAGALLAYLKCLKERGFVKVFIERSAASNRTSMLFTRQQPESQFPAQDSEGWLRSVLEEEKLRTRKNGNGIISKLYLPTSTVNTFQVCLNTKDRLSSNYSPGQIIDAPINDKNGLLRLTRANGHDFDTHKKALFATACLLFKLKWGTHQLNPTYSCDDCGKLIEAHTTYESRIDSPHLCTACGVLMNPEAFPAKERTIHPDAVTAVILGSDAIIQPDMQPPGLPITMGEADNVLRNIHHAVRCMASSVQCGAKACEEARQTVLHVQGCKNKKGCFMCESITNLMTTHSRYCPKGRLNQECEFPFCKTLFRAMDFSVMLQMLKTQRSQKIEKNEPKEAGDSEEMEVVDLTEFD